MSNAKVMTIEGRGTEVFRMTDQMQKFFMAVKGEKIRRKIMPAGLFIPTAEKSEVEEYLKTPGRFNSWWEEEMVLKFWYACEKTELFWQDFSQEKLYFLKSGLLALRRKRNYLEFLKLFLDEEEAFLKGGMYEKEIISEEEYFTAHTDALIHNRVIRLPLGYREDVMSEKLFSSMAEIVWSLTNEGGCFKK